MLTSKRYCWRHDKFLGDNGQTEKKEETREATSSLLRQERSLPTPSEPHILVTKTFSRGPGDADILDSL